MHQSRRIRRVLAALITTAVSLTGVVAAAQPEGMNLPEFSNELLSSDGPQQPPTQASAPAPEADANLQDVVPDMDFRRYLNKTYFERQNVETPISAADMAMLTEVGDEEARDGITIPNVNGDEVDYCGFHCTRPWVKPDLEGIQYATNLEVLAIRYVGKLPEFDTMPNLRMLYLDDAELKDYDSLDGKSFPALRNLVVTDLPGIYPTKLNTFTQLERLELHIRGVGEMPNEITELTTLKTLHYGSNEQITGPENIGNMVGLETLTLTGWGIPMEHRSKLTALPDSLGQLPTLKVLDLYGNRNLTALPAALLELDTLERVNLASTGIPADDPVREELQRRGVQI